MGLRRHTERKWELQKHTQWLRKRRCALCNEKYAIKYNERLQRDNIISHWLKMIILVQIWLMTVKTILFDQNKNRSINKTHTNWHKHLLCNEFSIYPKYLINCKSWAVGRAAGSLVVKRDTASCNGTGTRGNIFCTESGNCKISQTQFQWESITQYHPFRRTPSI